MRAAVLAVLALALVACQGPRRVETSDPWVSYRFSGADELDDAREEAADYCEETFGRDARLRDVVEREGPDLAIFDCV